MRQRLPGRERRRRRRPGRRQRSASARSSASRPVAVTTSGRPAPPTPARRGPRAPSGRHPSGRHDVQFAGAPRRGQGRRPRAARGSGRRGVKSRRTVHDYALSSSQPHPADSPARAWGSSASAVKGVSLAARNAPRLPPIPGPRRGRCGRGWKVQRDRPVVDVAQVEPQGVLPGKVAAPTDLPEPGQARPHLASAGRASRVVPRRPLSGSGGGGPTERHLPRGPR